MKFAISLGLIFGICFSLGWVYADLDRAKQKYYSECSKLNGITIKTENDGYQCLNRKSLI